MILEAKILFKTTLSFVYYIVEREREGEGEGV